MKIASAAVFVAAVLWAAPMLASPFCKERTAALEFLARKYGEIPVGMGVDSAGRLLEILASKDGKTWTIIVTRPGQKSCIVASGQGWTTIPFNLKDPEA